jgi:hypothetical protein
MEHSDFKSPFESIRRRLTEFLGQDSVLSSLAFESKRMNPSKFLDVHFPIELRLFLCTSGFNPIAITVFCFESADSILQIPLRELKFRHLFVVCVYYTLLMRCCCAAGPNSVEVINDTVARGLLRHAGFLLGNEFGGSTKYVRSNFRELLSAIGMRSSLLHMTLFLLLPLELQSSSCTARSLTLFLKPLVYLTSTIKQLAPAFGLVESSLSLFVKDKRKVLLETIQDMLSATFKRSVFCFRKFLSGTKAIDHAFSISEAIRAWNETESTQVLPTQIGLQLLLLPSQQDSLPVSQLRHFAENRSALLGLLFGWHALALSLYHQKLADLLKEFYGPFLEWLLTQKAAMTYGDRFAKYAYVDFPICCLLYNRDDFTSKLVPFLLAEKFDLGIYVARLIRRAAKLGIDTALPGSFFGPLLGPCVSLTQRSLTERNSRLLLPIVRGLCVSPDLLRLLLTTQSGFLDFFSSLVREHLELPFHEALIGVYNPGFADQTIVTAEYWAALNGILRLLSSLYVNDGIYSSALFLTELPQVMVGIADFLVQLFEYDTMHSASWVSCGGFDALALLEGRAIMFCASSRPESREAGIRILASLLTIVHSSEVFVECDLPLDQYERLVMDARRLRLLRPGDLCVKRALRMIPSRSAGMKTAWRALFYHFLALTISLPNTVELPLKPERTVELPVSSLTDEWIGTATIFFAIVADWNRQFFDIALALMADEGDIGVYTVVTIPTALNVQALMPFITAVSAFIERNQTADGFFENPSALAVVMRNALKIVRGIAEQPHWVAQTVNAEDFWRLLTHFVAYTDLMRGEEYRLLCAQCMVSVQKLLIAFDKPSSPKVKHKLAKTLLGWISSAAVQSKQFTTVSLAALELLFKNLALVECSDPSDPSPPETQARNQFMQYFATIKLKLDAGDTATAVELMPVLAGLLNQNLMIGIDQCISMGFEEKGGVRAAFIGAVASVFRVPEKRVVDAEPAVETTLLDILLTDGFALIEYLVSVIPLSRHEAVGAALVEGSVLQGIEFEFLGRMMDVEIGSVDEDSKQTLFRGNALPSRAVGYFPRLVGANWLTTTVRPIADVVIKRSEEGAEYQIDPRKLADGADLEANRRNVRALFEMSIQSITAARDSMPVGLIREAQLVYDKVFARYGDFAMQILSGFLFLRFLIPAFSVPKLIGLPEIIPEAPKLGLITISVMLMSAILHGTVSDKGPHMRPFDEIAARAQEEFTKMFMAIVRTKLPDTKDTIELSETGIIDRLHTELFPLVAALTQAKSEMEESNPLLPSLQALIAKLIAMGPPRTGVRSRGRGTTVVAKGGQSVESQLLALQFPEDAVKALHGFIIRQEAPAPDRSAVYLVRLSELPVVADVTIVAYVLFKALKAEHNETVSLVCHIAGFDERKLPPPDQLLVYRNTRLAKKITRVICVEPTPAFITFVNHNPQLFEPPPKLVFVSDVAALGEMVGSIARQLPVTAVESLTKPEWAIRAVVNGHDSLVRLHRSSIQFVGSSTMVQGTEVASVEVIMAEQVDHFTRPHAAPNGRIVFSISVRDGRVFLIKQLSEISLFESIVTLTTRCEALSRISSRVKIDSATLPWLMLIMGFVNMACGQTHLIVRKAALDLVFAVFASFSLKHGSPAVKPNIKQLPDNLLGFVCTLSANVAEHHPEVYNGFLTEFFAALEHVETPYKSVCLYFVRPWIKIWVKYITETPVFLDHFFAESTQIPYGEAAFRQNVWTEITNSTVALRMVMERLFVSMDDKLIPIVVTCAELAPKPVAEFWTKDAIENCITKGNDSIRFTCNVLAALMLAGGIPAGVHYWPIAHFALTIRTIADYGTLFGCKDFMALLIRTLALHNHASVTADFMIVAIAFWSTSAQNDFANVKGSWRPWLTLTTEFGDALSQSIVDPNFSEYLYKKFKSKFDETDVVQRSMSIIHGGQFAGKQGHNFVIRIVPALCKESDPRLIGAMCIALSKVTVKAEVAAKLFLLSIGVTLFLGSGDAICVVSATVKSAMTHFKSKKSVPGIEAISAKIGIAIDRMPYFAAFLLMVCFAERCDCRSLINAATVEGEPLSQILALLEANQAYQAPDPAVADSPSVVVALLWLTAKFHQPELIRFTTAVVNRRPFLLAGLTNIGKTPVVAALLKTAPNPGLLSAVSMAASEKGERPEFGPLVRHLVSESPRVILSAAEFNNLTAKIFR